MENLENTLKRFFKSFKNAIFIDVRNQLNVIYNGIDFELKRNIQRFKDLISFSKFLNNLDDFKHN